MRPGAISRRQFVLGGSTVGLGLLAGCGRLAFPAPATPSQLSTIGCLLAGNGASQVEQQDAFLQGLQALGYVEGQNLTIEYRYADGDVNRVPTLAAELVARQVAVIVVGATAIARLVRTVSSTMRLSRSDAQETD